MAKSPSITVTNPFTGEIITHLPYATPNQASQTLERASSAFRSWRRSSAWTRTQLLQKAHSRLETRAEEFAQLICQEAGKPIQLARGEVNRGLDVLQWAVGETQRFSGEILRLDTNEGGRMGFGIHARFPRGVVLGITPFNFPLNLALHKIAPAIACGCSIVIKPSRFTPLTAHKIVELFQCDTPGLVQVLLADDAMTAQLCPSSTFAHVSFTGSPAIGRLIQAQAPHQKTTLELGGNAWVILAEDTPLKNLSAIVKKINHAAFGYAGQSCISVQNVAVHHSLWPQFKKLFKESVESVPFGDPSAEAVISGPLIHARATERVRALFTHATNSEIVTSKNQIGDAHPDFPLFAPSVNLQNQSIEQLTILPPIIQEEAFGPFMTALPFERIDSLIEKINSGRFGLQTGVYTEHWPTIEKLFQELEVGGVIVNDVPTTRYDHQPYGGVKESGHGREGLRYAMEEMTEGKFLALSSRIQN